MSIKFEKGNFAVVPNIDEAMVLTEVGLKVYIALCKYTDQYGACFPSVTTLKEFTGLSETGVRKGLKELRDREFVSVTKRKRENGSSRSNHYQLLIITNAQVPYTPVEGDPTRTGPPLTIPIEHTTNVVPDGEPLDSSNLVDEKETTSPPVVEITTKKLYYDVVRKYQLVINNHNHVVKWAQDLEVSLGQNLAHLYLRRLLERDLRKERETEEFVPTLTKPMDICIKAPKIIEYFKRTKKSSLTDSRSYE